jgi:hypothetical protein
MQSRARLRPLRAARDYRSRANRDSGSARITMKPSNMDSALERLDTTSAFLEHALARWPRSALRSRPDDAGFSLVEHLWHLADLEREGYGERIRRIVAEHDPALPDFEGDRIARERRYDMRDPDEALALFRSARTRNLAALRGASAADLARTGTQEHVGRVTLSDVARMMAEHDESHRCEIDAAARLLGV